jgi:iron complex transport system substrate-binding protein
VIRRTSLLVLIALAVATASFSTGPAVAGTAPGRIVSLSPTATEMLFAIGAGPQVVAVDDQSDYPAAAPTTDLSGYEPNVEAIAGYRPDLVVLSGRDAKRPLEKLGITTLVLPAADELDDAYAQIRRLGKVTGHRDEANAVAARMKTEIAELLGEVPKGGDRPLAYYELDDTYFSADSTTFIGRLMKLAGFTNIADEARGDNSGYPQLSAEAIVAANPDVIFLADTECCGQTAETLAKRPGFSKVAAVTDGHVVELDEDVSQRWGPRVVELLRTMVEERSSL